jgi:hypothetical protein
VTVARSPPHGDCESEGQTQRWKPSIDLVVRPRNPDRTPLGQDGTVRPLRYATYEFAAKAAAVYFAKHPAKKTHSALASSTAGGPSKK